MWVSHMSGRAPSTWAVHYFSRHIGRKLDPKQVGLEPVPIQDAITGDSLTGCATTQGPKRALIQLGVWGRSLGRRLSRDQNNEKGVTGTREEHCRLREPPAWPLGGRRELGVAAAE